MLGLPILSYFLIYIVSTPTHDIEDHMETSNRKDRLNRIRLRSDDTDDPYDRDDYIETKLKDERHIRCSCAEAVQFIPLHLNCTGTSGVRCTVVVQELLCFF